MPYGCAHHQLAVWARAVWARGEAYATACVCRRLLPHLLLAQPGGQQALFYECDLHAATGQCWWSVACCNTGLTMPRLWAGVVAKGGLVRCSPTCIHACLLGLGLAMRDKQMVDPHCGWRTLMSQWTVLQHQNIMMLLNGECTEAQTAVVV